MDEKLKTEIILLFNQGVEEVVIPLMKEMLKDFRQEVKDSFKQVSTEFKVVNEELGNVKKELRGVNEKLDRFERSNDRVAEEQVDVRARLRRIENAVFKQAE